MNHLVGQPYYLGVIKNMVGNHILAMYFPNEGTLINAITNKVIDSEELASDEFNTLHERPAKYTVSYDG